MSDDQNNHNAMRDSKDTSQPEASFAPCPGWDAAVDAADSYDHEIKILEEAQRIIKQNELPQFTWQTWDVWAGRTVHHLEDTQGWMRRVLQRARENVGHPNSGKA